MLEAETGNSGGNKKRTVVTIVYAIPIKFAIQPKGPGKTKALGPSIFLPRQTLIATGIA